MNKRKSGWAEALNSLGLVSYLGTVMVVSVAIGLFLGVFFYKKSNNIMFVMAGIIVGVASGFLSVYKVIQKETEKE